MLSTIIARKLITSRRRTRQTTHLARAEIGPENAEIAAVVVVFGGVAHADAGV